MKKLFAVLIAFALVFASCPTESNPNADVIGVWTDEAETITLDIADGTWISIVGSSTTNGKWTRDANTLAFKTYSSTYGDYRNEYATASLSEDKLFFKREIITVTTAGDTTTYTTYILTKKNKTPDLPPGTLKINNQSFTDITDVTWNNVSFGETDNVNSIRSGNNVIKNVEAGGGYIFFKRRSNPISARTKEFIIVEEGKKNVEFIFRDETVIIEINNTDNTGTLKDLQNTVVWWDDAEGELQPYYLRQNFAGYYSTAANLSITNTDISYYYAPKNGKKSIAIGSSATSLLHLKINLAKKAKLSFWYANRGTANFSINDVDTLTSSANIAWSFVDFELKPGMNDLVWKNTSTTATQYFFLDDILIYYTE